MLCRGCRRQLPRDAARCSLCGRPRRAATAAAGTEVAAVALELIHADGTSTPLDHDTTLGRAEDNDIVLPDPSVSRHHARITLTPAGPAITDAGSSHGTFVDGDTITASTPLRDGATVELGDVRVQVATRRQGHEAGATLVVPPGSTLETDAVTAPGTGTLRPRLRRGWALKRLEAADGERRYVLRDLAGTDGLRLDEDDVALLRLIDGTRTMSELLALADERDGAAGCARLTGLIATLADATLLDVGGATGAAATRRRDRRLAWRGAPAAVERLYTRGGFLLFTRAAYTVIVVVALAGLVAFGSLVAGDEATPLLVDGELSLGALAFIAGRLALVAVHELAHALTLTSFGRRIGGAGLRLLAGLPLAFVDTSDSAFEPRRRRLAVTAAGPVADAVGAGAFAIVAVAAGGGAAQDVLFQVALGAYLALALNLNPLGARDGYLLAADGLREPALRAIAAEALGERLRGGGGRALAPHVRRYATAAAAWLALTAAFVATIAATTWTRLTDATAELPVLISWVAVGAGLLLPALVTVIRAARAAR